MTVLQVPGIDKGHKFESYPEVACAKTEKNRASSVVNVGKDLLIPF
jgi:hypothetical protein